MILTDQTNQGHSQACSYVLSDDITIKNIAAYRKSPIFATQPIDGISALTFTQQTEFHLARQLDVIVGGRLTKDKKSSIFRHGASLAARNVIPCTYRDARFIYLPGVNFKPTDDMLFCGKWSTRYVTGGSTAGNPYDAETAKSAELGFKGQFLDN